MKELRTAFRKALEESGAPGNWDHVTKQTGMFIYSPFTGKVWKTSSDYVIRIRLVSRKIFRRRGSRPHGSSPDTILIRMSPNIWHVRFLVSQLEYLRKIHHVYIISPGRINLTGLNKNNIKYVAEAISDALKKVL